jgi:hypothetical protein
LPSSCIACGSTALSSGSARRRQRRKPLRIVPEAPAALPRTWGKVSPSRSLCACKPSTCRQLGRPHLTGRPSWSDSTSTPDRSVDPAQQFARCLRDWRSVVSI